MVLVRRTRAIFRSAEFGFFGVIVRTWMHTPRFCGEPLPHSVRLWRALYVQRSAGAFVFRVGFWRPRLTSWLIVGTFELPVLALDPPARGHD